MRLRTLVVMAALTVVAWPSVAQDVRFSSACESAADFDSTATVTFTSAGKCGNAVVIDSNADLAEWVERGKTHCSDSDTTDEFPECTAPGEQIRIVTIQFWYSCDTDGDGYCECDANHDGACDVMPASSATMLGRNEGTYTPTVLKYDGSQPISTFRTYNSAAQHSLSGVDLYDGKWHRIKYSYDIDGNRRKFCVDDSCVEDTSTAVVGFAASETGTFGFRPSNDPDIEPGAYDEFQLAAGYDIQFDSDGPGCGVAPEEAAAVPTQDVGFKDAWGTSFVTGGCGSVSHDSGCKVEVEMRNGEDETAPLFYHGFVPVLSASNFRTSIVYPERWEFGDKFARVRCQLGSDCSATGQWSGWAAWYPAQQQKSTNEDGATHGIAFFRDDFTRDIGNISGQDHEEIDGGAQGWSNNLAGAADADNMAYYDVQGRVSVYGNTEYHVRHEFPENRFLSMRIYGTSGGHNTLWMVISGAESSWRPRIGYFTSDATTDRGWGFIDENGTQYNCDFDGNAALTPAFYRIELMVTEGGKHRLRLLRRYATQEDKPWAVESDVIAEDDCPDWAGKDLPWGNRFVGFASSGADNYKFELDWFEAGPLSADGHPAASRRVP